jgi:hypothetical protein
MSHWFDKAAEELERDLEAGHISLAAFREAMSELNAELRDAQHEAAEEAYDNYYG